MKAYLYRLVEVGGGGAGFLLPVFLEYRGANHYLVQRIDSSDNVSGFDPFLFDGGMLKLGVDSLSAEIGSPAIWVFRDTTGRIHIGTQSEISKIGRNLLEVGAFHEHFVAGAEMAAFINDEVSFPSVMLSAYGELAKLSRRGADAWRDTVVLLPRVKEDLASSMRLGRDARKSIDEVVAISHARTTHIFAASNILEAANTLPRWRATAKIFGIDSFEFHESKVDARTRSTKLPSWIFFGIGGVARWVIKKSPFHGDLTTFAELPSAGGAIVVAPISQRASSAGNPVRLMIAAVMSDATQASVVDRIANGLGSNDIIKHAINIRPIGFGTPKRSKPSPRDIAKVLNGFDYVWIVANHRQRQAVNYINLTGSHVASRFVRACALALISCLDSENGRLLLRKTTATREFGLVGAVRYKSSPSQGDILRRVLYTMLCEDAQLHTAKQIVIFWPYTLQGDERWQRVRLGRHQFDVELVERSGKKSHYDVVGLAFDVQISKRTSADFRDFCISLFSGYGWVPRHENDEYVLLENEGEAIRIWPVQSTNASSLLTEHDAEFARSSDVIVTNQTLSTSLRERANDRGWEILHYSELDTWMEQSFPSIAAEGFRVD